MNKTIKSIIILFFVYHFSFFSATAQVGINTDNSDPDPSAMLDVSSTDKGMLMPRMTSTQREAINNPATGLLVFDSTTENFWFYQTSGWLELKDTNTDAQALSLSNNTLSLSNGGSVDLSSYLDNTDAQDLSLSDNTLSITNGSNIDLSTITTATLSDADGDTNIQVEADGKDDDIIRMKVADTEPLQLTEEELRLKTDFYASLDGYASSSSRTVNYTIDGNAFASFDTDNASWQSFKATENGKVDKIELLFRDELASSYEIKIYEGEGTVGKLLTTTILSNPNEFTWNEIPILDEVVLNEGLLYTVWFSNKKSVGFESGNLYPDGRSKDNTDYDYLLHVYTFAEQYNFSVTESGGVTVGDITLPTVDGTDGQVLTTDGNGTANWEDGMTADDLGNHTATQIINTNNNWLSGDGDAEGIQVSATGGVSTSSTLAATQTLSVQNSNQNFQMKTNSASHYVQLDVSGTTHSSDKIYIGDLTTSGNTNPVVMQGKVGIGVDIASNSANQLEVSGNAAKDTGSSWSTTSDARLKQNVASYLEGLTEVMQLNPVTFQYNELSGYDTSTVHVGVIAQELLKVAPHMVQTFEHAENGETYYTVNNSAMTYMLINTVQEQQTEIETQNQRIKTLEAKLSELDELKATLSQIQAQLDN
jgi:hypothetical protein